MTKATRVVLIVGLLLVLLAALFPPMTFVYPRQGDNFYFAARRSFLFALPDTMTKQMITRGYDPSRGYVRVDYHRLMVEWVVIAAGTGAAFLFTRRRRP